MYRKTLEIVFLLFIVSFLLRYAAVNAKTRHDKTFYLTKRFSDPLERRNKVKGGKAERQRHKRQIKGREGKRGEGRRERVRDYHVNRKTFTIKDNPNDRFWDWILFLCCALFFCLNSFFTKHMAGSVFLVFIFFHCLFSLLIISINLPRLF